MEGFVQTGKDTALGEMVQWVVDQSPGAAVFGLALLVAVGVVLWLLGSRLAKPAAVVSGVVLGASVAGGLAGLWSGMGTLTIAFITLGGAVLGGVLSGVLFRLWMGLSGAIVLAAVVPAGVLVWQGTSGLEVPGTTEGPGLVDAETAGVEGPPVAGLSGAERDGAGDGTSGDGDPLSDFLRRNLDEARLAAEGGEALDGEGDSPEQPGGLDPQSMASGIGGEQARQAIEQVGGQVKEAARTVWLKNAEAVQNWWTQVGPDTQKVVYTGAIAGGVIGLLLGLLMPTGSAMLQTSVVGALLLLLPGRELIALKTPEYAGFLPDTPRQLVIALGLITVLGVGLQWMLRRRRAEK